MSPQPLHLILVASGVGPRREALSFVQSGRVRLNGEKVVDTLVTADLQGGDIVTLDDRSVLPERLRYVLIHKPRGVLCAMSDNNEWRGEDNDYPKFERRTLVSSLVPANITERLGHAGRLDLDSEGLVILTNDRKMMRLVTRPGGGTGASCRKKYNVTVKGTPSEVDLNFLRNGPTVGGMGQLLPCKIEMLEHIAAPIDENNNNNVRGFTRLCVELKEGKNNQIRRMFGFVRHRVVRLVRISIGFLSLESVPHGGARELSLDEVESLRLCCGDSVLATSVLSR